MPVNGIKLKEGQIWSSGKRKVTLKKNEGATTYKWKAIYEDEEWETVTKDGKRWTSDYDSFLRELIYDPEQQVKEKLIMKFNPQPGDKIICNNGEEFICCTLEFLRETIYEGIKSDKPILGSRKFGYDEVWMDWDEDGKASYDNDDDYNIREVIPQSVENSTGKKEVALYTVEEVTEAFANALHLVWMGGHKEGIEKVKDYLEKKSNKEYQEYLRLKAIYE